MIRKFKYDVFLSYSSKDKAIVWRLAERLKRDKLRVWINAWEINVSDIIGSKVELAIEQSRVLILCMSENAFASDWATLERQTVLFRDPTKRDRRFIPLRIDDAPIHDTLKQFAYLDWREESQELYDKLLSMCRPIVDDSKLTPTLIAHEKKLYLRGHTASIFSIAVTTDGQRAFSGSADGTIRVWDVKSGQCLAILDSHDVGFENPYTNYRSSSDLRGTSYSIKSIAVTANGRRVISGSDNRAIKVWGVDNGQCLATLEGHTGGIRSVSLTANGRLAISGSNDRTIRVWDVDSGQCLAILEGHTNSISSVALTADGHRIISGSDDKTLRVWDVDSGQCLATLEGHPGSVSSIAVTADGHRAVSAGRHEENVRVWDVDSGQCLATLKGHTDSVYSVALTPDGRYAVSAGTYERIARVWDLESLRCIATLRGHTGNIRSVAVTADGRYAISGSDDSTVRVWDAVSGQCVCTFDGHTDSIESISVTVDGCYAISGSQDKTVRVWNVDSGQCLATLEGHTGSIRSVSLMANGRRAISGSDDKTVRVWDVDSGQCLATLKGHTGSIICVALMADGGRAISVTECEGIRIWDLDSGQCLATLEGHTGSIRSISLTADGQRVISGSDDKTVRVWNVDNGQCLATLEGHSGSVRSVSLAADGQRALSGSDDRTVRVWDLVRGSCLATLEGHTGSVRSVSLVADGQRALSGSTHGEVLVWDVNEGSCLATLEGHTSDVMCVLLRADGNAVSCEANGKLHVWGLASSFQEGSCAEDSFIRYTNAKVLLVGESGAGKTALSIRLTEDRFEAATISTDAFHTKRPEWATQLKLDHDGAQGQIEREIWLWDFAGQADYRLIHQLYMDETALAVLVFNPQSENPFEALGQWDRDLQRAARRPFSKLLVAGRCDRGGLMISRDNIEHFLRERGFADYIETSALQGTGCDKLRDAIISNIPWGGIPWIASPRIFRLLKDEIVKLKDEGKVLFRIGELKQQLEMRLPREFFTLEQLRAVVGLLAGPGIIWQLEFGDFVLLQPERVNSYAAAVIRSVRAHTEDIGCIPEEQVLFGKIDYQDMNRLPADEEQIALRAMHQTFVDHGLCLREYTDRGTLLIFPSYFKRERPELEGHPLVLVTYRFSGPLEEIYATLIVRLHHTDAFERDRLWRFAADFKTPSGKRHGLKMIKTGEGSAELEVYFEQGISTDVQVTFLRYVHDHLKLKATDVVRLRHYVCQDCQMPIEGHKAIEFRLSHGHKDIFCSVCGKSVLLWDLIEEKFTSDEYQLRARDLELQAKSAIDNESRELILVGHTYAIVGEAGQIYRQYTNSDHGIDGEIEFKDHNGKVSGKRLYLQLKSGDSYLHKRKDGEEIFTIKKERHAEYWQQHEYPVMLVIRTSDGTIRWMNVSEYLKRESKDHDKVVKHIIFKGESFTALNLMKLRDKFISLLPVQ